MPALTVYKLRNPFEGEPVDDFDRYLAQGREPDAHEILEIPAGEARLYTWNSPPRPPKWEGWLQTGWGGLVLPRRAPVGALVIVRTTINRRDHYFAIPLGTTGRFILEQSAIERAYGLRTALNIMYPRSLGTSKAEGARILSLDAKRRAKDVIRSRVQSSAETTFETFEVDELRDVVNAATGRPADIMTWGHRVTGADGFTLAVDETVLGIAEVCRRIETAHGQDDYRARFGWIDDIQPVNDPDLLERLQRELIENIRDGALDELELAPPEIVTWEKVDVFRYHTDGHQDTKHRQLRLADYRAALGRTGQLEELNLPLLKRGFIKALDASGELIHQWSPWAALVGTVDLAGMSYVIEGGEFFTVSDDYLHELDSFVEALAKGATVLPSCPVGFHEKAYNERAAAELGALLLDRENVVIPGKTTAIEVCDLLTRHREMVHIKREFGSRDLSHLFSQGTTSSELVHDNEAFRTQVQKKVMELAGDNRFAFFDEKGIVPSAFTVTYAVIGDWKGQTVAARLSFFSKINLRRAITDLRRRGYQVAFQKVDQEL